MNGVGPVLIAGERANAIVSAIRELNPEAVVVERGAYLRVSAPTPCVLTRAAIERVLGEAFELPGDLEQVMTSFAGTIVLAPGEVRWEARGT